MGSFAPKQSADGDLQEAQPTEKTHSTAQAIGSCPPQSADGDLEAQPAEKTHSTAQATSSSPPQQSADGDRAVTLSPMQKELELLQKLPEWVVALQQVVQENLAGRGAVGNARGRR